MSLAIVGVVSLLGAVQKARSQLVHWKAASAFGAAGIPGALLGAQATPLVPPPVLLLIFALLMLGVAIRMWRSPLPAPAAGADCSFARCLAAGFGVGGLTGFLGVGGGFLLVPALVYFALLTPPVAVGTSLAIIALNSLAGLVGHWPIASGHGASTAWFVLAASAGMLVGLPLAPRLSARALHRSFAGFVALLGLFVIAETLFNAA